jgi:hypothetical protein
MSLDLTTDATVRIGDADREHAVAAPGRHLSVGRLTMAEFENRRHRLRRHNPRRPRRRSGRPTSGHPAVSTTPTGPVRTNTPVAMGASSALGVSGELGGSGALGGVDPDRRHLPAHLDRHFGSPGPPALFLAVLVIGPWGALLLVHTAVARIRPPNRSASSNASPITDDSA